MSTVIGRRCKALQWGSNLAIYLRTILMASLVLSLASCGDSEFKGFGGAAPAGKDKSTGKSPRDSKDPKDRDGNGVPDDEEVRDRDEEPLNRGIDTSDGDVCSTDGEVNVVMVFDNSGSQSASDLDSMRQGATSMIGGLTSLATSQKFKVHVSTVRFSNAAIVGSYRWVELGEGNDGDIFSDINQSTADDGGNTHYAAALNQASSLFSERDIKADDKNKRNFVVFLSDGKPDDDAQVQGVSQALVQQYSAAMITIGTGGRNFSQLQSMASLSSADFPKGHRGQFFQAENQSDVVGVFADVYDIIENVCDK